MGLNYMKSIQVALIRGINVGPSKRVAMADLRGLMVELGYQDVHTILNSGNVVFTSQDRDTAAAAQGIKDMLFVRTGVNAKVTVLTAKEIEAIMADNPLDSIATDPSRLIIAILMNPEDKPQIEALQQQPWAPEALVVGARVAYLWCPDGVLASRLNLAVNKILGDNVTSRNWATFMRIYNFINK